MKQFIPFEDDWDALERLCPDALIPYHVGFVSPHDMADAKPRAVIATSIVAPSAFSLCGPMRLAAPADNAST